jgi:hypothetical protein
MEQEQNNQNQNPRTRKNPKAPVVFLFVFFMLVFLMVTPFLDFAFSNGESFFFIIPFMITPLIIFGVIVSVVIKALKTASRSFKSPEKPASNQNETLNITQDGSTTNKTTIEDKNSLTNRISSFMGLMDNSSDKENTSSPTKIEEIPDQVATFIEKTLMSLDPSKKTNEAPINKTPHTYDRSTPEVPLTYDKKDDRYESRSTKKITCPGCRKRILETSRYCDYCGEPATKTCPSCQRENPRGSKTCVYCKSRL